MQIIAAILFVPFFGWGLYTLQRRFQFQEECTPVMEVTTLLAIVLFLSVEINQLQIWLSANKLTYMFTVLSLFVSSAALYGHLAISFCSRMVVDIISPSDEFAQDVPRFGPAEILESDGDYVGALQEYLVLARIFPRNPEIMTRVAENLLRLSRHEEWLDCMMKTLKLLAKDKDCKPLLAHLCGVYERELEDEGTLISILNTLMNRHPETLLAETAKYHLNRVSTKGDIHHAHSLQALSETSLDEALEVTASTVKHVNISGEKSLAAYEDVVSIKDSSAEENTDVEKDKRTATSKSSLFSPLEDLEIAEEAEPPEDERPPTSPRGPSGFEAM